MVRPPTEGVNNMWLRVFIQYFQIVLLILFSILPLQACGTAFSRIADDLNKEMAEKSERDKTRQYQDKFLSAVSYDDLHLYVGIRKQDVLAQLYSGIRLRKIRTYSIPSHNTDGSVTMLTVEDYLVARNKISDQIELGMISFVDNKLRDSTRYLKTYEASEAIKAIDYFGDIVLKTRRQTTPHIIMHAGRHHGNGISVTFIAKDKSVSKEIALYHVVDNGRALIAVREILYEGYRAD